MDWRDIPKFDPVGSFRRGYGAAALGNKDYERAERSYIQGEDYEGAERARTYSERERDTRYRQDAVRALANDDWGALQNAAVERGSLEGVQMARTGRSEAAKRTEEDAYRWAQDNQPTEDTWAEFRQRVMQSDNPIVRQYFGRFASAPQWNPALESAWANASRNLRNRLLTAQQQVEMENDLEARRLQARGIDVQERRAAAAETTAEAALRRADTGGAGHAQWRTMTPDEVESAGLPPGTVAQVDDRTGSMKTIRAQRQYSDAAAQSAQYADRMSAADTTMRALEDRNVNPTAVYAFGMGDRNAQSYRQAQREFVNAILRRESGAVISDSEFDSARQQYFPVPGDPPQVREQKRQARQRAIRGLINASQGAYQEWYGGGAPPSGDGGGAATDVADPLGIR